MSLINQFCDGERHIFAKPEPMTLSEWASRNIIVKDGPYSGSKYRREVNPYLVGIMDAWSDDDVCEVIVAGSAQTGKTLVLHSAIAYSIARRPGPKMLAMQDDNAINKVVNNKLLPIFRASKVISPLIHKVRSGRVTFIDGSALYLASAASSGQRASISVRDLFIDEEALYQKIQGQGDPVAELLERTRSYSTTRKILRVSKPIGGEECSIITALHNEADVVFEYAMRCPACGALQVPNEDNLRAINDETNPALIIRHRLARYKCEKCGQLWTDGRRDTAVAHGEWVNNFVTGEVRDGEYTESKYTGENATEKHVGFHLPAILSSAVSLSEIYAEKLKSKNAEKMKVQQYMNGLWAVAYVPQYTVKKSDEMLALCDDRPRGVVPGKIFVANNGTGENFGGNTGTNNGTNTGTGTKKSRVCCLLAGVDTQLRYFRYVIRAFGFGESPDTWLVQEGVAPDFAALEDIMFRAEYKDVDGNIWKVRAVIIDAMGEVTRTAQVYDWAARNKGRVLPSQGVHRMVGAPWKLSPLEWFPTVRGERRRINGGLNLYRLDSTYYKNILASRLSIAPTDPGAFHLHAEEKPGQLKSYCEEMCAESWDANENGGTWVNVKGAPNHAWDCEYLVLALSDITQIKNLPNPDDTVRQETTQRQPAQVMRAADRLARIRR